jgi:outer membrane protein
MQKQLLFIFTALWVLSATVSVQAENLLQVYEQAKQNDPAFRAAQAQYAAEQEATSQAWAPLLPQLNASAGRTKTEQTVNSSSIPLTLPVGDYNTTTNLYKLSLTQTLYRHDRIVALRQADTKVARAQANYGNAQQELILRVAQRYFEVLAADDNLTFAHAEKQAIEQQLQQTQQRFRVGLNAITDVHEAQARYDQAISQEIAAENLLAITREAIRELTGTAVTRTTPLQEQTPLLAPDPTNLDEWVKAAMAHNLALFASEKAMDIASDDINRIRAGHYPTLDLVGERSSSDVTGSSATNTDQTSLTLQLNIPLYQGGLVSSQTREAAARHMQNKELYEQQRRSTERQTRSSYLSVIANISQVKALKQTLKSTQTALEATQTGFEVGTRTLVDVLNSQRELYRAQRDYAKSRYDYIVETLKLKQAAGSLNDTDLQHVAHWVE